MKRIKELGFSIAIIGMLVTLTQCEELGAIDQDILAEIDSLELETVVSDTLFSEIIDSDTTLVGLLEEEINGILFMREEEKLARDVYLYLYEIYPLRPFLNISKSEQAHMDAIKYLIDTFNLTDPVADSPEGVFQNELLQSLYNELIERGSANKIEALKVGALIEEIDIIDLQHELDETVENKEVARVYENLLKASENHLRAFVRVLKGNDVDYVPVKLNQELFDAIMAE